jgi:hypothetical protein
MFSKVAGKLWVDKQDLGWIKVDGQVIQPFSMGLFLVRLLRGSHITMEQTRVDDGTWMPERIEVRAAARIFFVKSLVIDRVLTYSEYRLPQTGVPTTRDPVSLPDNTQESTITSVRWSANALPFSCSCWRRRSERERTGVSLPMRSFAYPDGKCPNCRKSR